MDNLDEMVKNPWVDSFIIGPCDMSASIGQIFRIYEEPTGKLIQKAVDICRSAGKSIGISLITQDEKLIRYWYDMGINVLSCGSDLSHIVDGGKNVLSILNKLKKH